MTGAQVKAETGLLSRLEAARATTDQLFDVVKSEALYDRPIAERHRLVFYIGHLEAFDWNLFHGRAFEAKSLNPEFDQLFAFGIDPVGGGLPTDQPSDWPTLKAVHEYRKGIRQELDTHLENGQNRRTPANGSQVPTDTLLNVAIEHRLMHAETLAYLLHQLPLDRKVAQPSRELASSPASGRRIIEIPAGTATLGLPRTGDRFGWDNEFDVHRVEVPAFAIDEYKVTNGEFMKFIQEGGYQERSVWDNDGWQWINTQDVHHPAFWTGKDGSWSYRTMFHDIALPLDWPVYVSHAEAAAYVRWAGKSLPTEAQWHRAAYGTPAGSAGQDGLEREYPWGSEAPGAQHGNFDFAHWDPTPVNAYPRGRSAFEVADMLGNGWEWTSTLFAPLPGFEPFSFYPGYSANFFDGKHYVMKGASARTAACMLRRSFRNWFQPHYPFVYVSFRCVAN